MFTSAPLHPLFASEISDFDLASAADPEVLGELENLFESRLVLVFRDQRITDDQQIAFSQRFGPLETTKVGTPGAGSQLITLSNIDADGNVVALKDRALLNNRANQHWHADSSFKRNPAKASLLSARIIPSAGGNTEYISMRAVYAALGETDKARIDNLIAIHDFAYGRQKISPDLVLDAERREVPPVPQRMVLDHGKHGKSLYLGAHCATIQGMEEAEARALIDELMAFANQDRFIYSHRWRAHDLIMWHNRAVVHRATPFASQQEKRLMVRTTVAGPGPTVDEDQA